jgi:uncharacterized membrane protein
MSFEIGLPLSPRIIMLSIVGIFLLINYAYFLPKSIKCLMRNDTADTQGYISVIHTSLSCFLLIVIGIFSVIYIGRVISQNTWFPT